MGVEEAHDLGTLIVGFAESPDGSGISLSFQSDLDDAPNRTDDYSISNELGATVYGGVTRYELNRTGSRWSSMTKLHRCSTSTLRS